LDHRLIGFANYIKDQDHIQEKKKPFYLNCVRPYLANLGYKEHSGKWMIVVMIFGRSRNYWGMKM